VGRDDLVDFFGRTIPAEIGEPDRCAATRDAAQLSSASPQIQGSDTGGFPLINLESPKIRRHLPGYLRLEEVEKLLEQPDSERPWACATRAMLEVLYSTGLRVSELIGLRVTDLDSKVGCVRCIGKGDKERIVPVGKKALSMVDKYLREGRPFLLRNAKITNRSGLIRKSPRCGPESSGRLGRYFRLTDGVAGLRIALTPHMLRHSFATQSTGAWRGLALGAIDAGACRYFHDPDLYPCCRGAV